MKCAQCGTCCKLFLINLARGEYNSGLYNTELGQFGFVKDFKEARALGANILKQKKDGSCIYLRNNKCSIHGSRPKSCREFFCTSKNPKFKGMIKDIKEYKGELKQNK